MKSNILKFFLPVLLAFFSYYLNFEFLLDVANLLSKIFIKFLSLISVPIVFLSIVSTLSGFKFGSGFNDILKKTLKYTFLTTIIASIVALMLYIAISPADTDIVGYAGDEIVSPQKDYLSHLIDILPSNFLQSFIDNNVIGVVIIAFLIGAAIMTLDDTKRSLLHDSFAAMFEVFAKVSGFILFFIPYVIWAFTLLFINEMAHSNGLHNLFKYTLCVVLANLIQAFIVLPMLLLIKGCSPVKVFMGVFDAIVIAFFSKSSNATLPTTIKCVQSNLGVSKRVSSFSLPLCTTINMNGCSAFILITVLFVSESNMNVFSTLDLCLWVLLSTAAAIGNAGVPMGCYFMATTYLVAMDVPLEIMGLILPIYSFLDMLETSTNVWSDVCVSKVVDREYSDTVDDTQ